MTYTERKKTVADLQRKILNACPHSNFAYFHAVFMKIWPNNRLAPSRPIWKILDPPLQSKVCFSNEKSSGAKITNMLEFWNYNTLCVHD